MATAGNFPFIKIATLQIFSQAMLKHGMIKDNIHRRPMWRASGQFCILNGQQPI